MGIGTMGVLAGLALVDSTSFGTLGVPAAMLVQRRVRAAMVVLYLLTIGVFYWLLGLALVFGATAVTERLAGLGQETWLLWVQLLVGVALAAGSFVVDSAWLKDRRSRRREAGQVGWTQRRTALVLGERARPGAVVTLALVAGVVEAASMLPYLGAVGVITSSGLSIPAVTGVLGLYVVVMSLPAALLLVLRMAAHRQVEPLLVRIDAWLSRAGNEMLAWVLGIVGFLLVADAGQRLGLVNIGLPT